MPENKSFQLAVLVSVLLHSMLFMGLPRMPFLPSTRSLQTMEITYYKIKEMPKKQTIAKKTEPVVKKLPKVTKEDILKPPQAAAKKVRKAEQEPRQMTVLKDAKEKTFARVVEEEQDDAKKATYISYYRAVREKIRELADRNYPKNKKLAEGEVFLSLS